MGDPGARRLLTCLLLAGVASACGPRPYRDCDPAVVLTPAPVQGQPYQLHVGEVAVMELVQVPIFCTVAYIDSARWQSSDPQVAAIGAFEGPTRYGGQFPAQVTATRAGRTTIRAFYRRRGKEAEAAESQEVFVLPRAGAPGAGE